MNLTPQFLYETAGDGGGGGGAPASAAPAEQGSNGLYDQALAGVSDPSLRAQVEPILKEFDANVTRRFQEAAEFRKQWEPYGELGLDQYSPEQLTQLLGFAQMAQDEDAFKEWVSDVYSQLHGEEGEPGVNGADGEIDPDDIDARIAKAVEDAVAPFKQQAEAQAQEQQLAEMSAQLDERLDELIKEHELSDEEVPFVVQLAAAYPNSVEDPIGEAYKVYEAQRAFHERNFVSGKIKAPAPPVQGGLPATALKPPRSYADAEAAAKAMLSGSAGSIS